MQMTQSKNVKRAKIFLVFSLLGFIFNIYIFSLVMQIGESTDFRELQSLRDLLQDSLFGKFNFYCHIIRSEMSSHEEATKKVNLRVHNLVNIDGIIFIKCKIIVCRICRTEHNPHSSISTHGGLWIHSFTDLGTEC